MEKDILNDETSGYYMARIKFFCLKIGIDPTKMKFRQHMDNEMAHYAKDCWDLECLTSHGWVECIGCADRSCFDLQCHASASKVSLSAERPLSQPRQEDTCEVVPNKKVVGKTFKRQAGKVTSALENCKCERNGGRFQQRGVVQLPTGRRFHSRCQIQHGYREEGH